MTQQYLEFLEYGRQLAPNTIKSVEHDLSLFGDNIADATRQEVERFVMDQNKQGLSTATVARRIASLRGFFEWQIYNGYREGINPAAGKIAPKIKNVSHAAISYDRLLQLYDNAPDDTIKIAITLAGFAGLRLGEIVGVGTRNPLYHDKNGVLAVQLNDTKGGGSRTVTLGLAPEPKLIESINGIGLLGKRGVLSENGLWRRMREYFDSEGLKDFSPHGLRATFASISVEREVRVDIVRDMLGHATLDGNAITSRYVRVATVEEQYGEVVGCWSSFTK